MSVKMSLPVSMPSNNSMTSSQQHQAQFSAPPPPPVHFRRRARRGKKRRCHEPMISAQSQSLPQTTATTHHKGATGRKGNNSHPLKKRCIQIRPADVPKAPANFTQFIIDDHFGSCPGLYKSFETPPAGGPDSSSDSEAPHSSVNYDDSESSMDAPLEYSDMVAFYEKDFEEVYSDARAAEVIELPREQLVAMYGDLEKRAAELSSELSVYSPQHLLDLLQQRLLQLQEENRQLRAKNRALRYSHSEHSDDSQVSVDSETDSSSTSSDSSESSESSDDDLDVGAPVAAAAPEKRASCSRDRHGVSDMRTRTSPNSETVRDNGHVTPDCVNEINDNAMFQLDSSSLCGSGAPSSATAAAADAGDSEQNEEENSSGKSSCSQKRRPHSSSNNEGSSSTLDFRSFQDALFSQSHSPTSRRTVSSGTIATAATSSGHQSESFAEDRSRQSVAAASPQDQQDGEIAEDVDLIEDADKEDGDEPMRIVEPSQLLERQQQQQHEQEVQVTSSCKTPVSDSSPPYGEIEAMG